jgi:hypothetical protein
MVVEGGGVVVGGGGVVVAGEPQPVKTISKQSSDRDINNRRLFI